MTDILILVISVAIFIIPLWVICKKAGFNPALSLLHLIPVLGPITVMSILAFRQWPNGEAASWER